MSLNDVYILMNIVFLTFMKLKMMIHDNPIIVMNMNNVSSTTNQRINELI